jgi:transcriptional regulator GlxA family with amidase domain
MDYNCYYVTKSQVISNALKEGDYIGGWFKANKKGGHFNVMPLPKDDDKAFESISPINTRIDSLGLSYSKPARMPLVYGIFAPPNFKIDQITEVLKILNLVKKRHGNISIEMIALDPNTPSHVGGPSLHSLDDCPDLDVFIVPGVRRVQELTKEQLDKVAKICKKTDHIFGIETGTLLLAESGILAGKSACCQSFTNSVSKFPIVHWDHSPVSNWKTDKGYWTSSSSLGTKTAFAMFIEKMYPKGDSASVGARLETTKEAS